MHGSDSPHRDASQGEGRPQSVAVRLSGVAKSFGDKAVLSNISLDIAEGSFLAIVGKSGSGKSTLLRLIAELDPPTKGSVVSTAAGASRLMFQEPRLLPWARVGKNVAIGLGSRPKVGADTQAINQALTAVGLLERQNDWPSILSGGQKQRVSLARALVGGPRLLALDEPLGALDALTRIDMQVLIEDVWSRLKFTTVLVTHDVAEAVVLADRIIVVEGGGIGLDIPVDLPRPRRRGDPNFAALEGMVLAHLLKR